MRLLLEFGINLADIDDWIESGSWASAPDLRQVMAWRARLLLAESADAQEAWGLYLMTLVHFNRRQKVLRPLAAIGQWLKPRLDRVQPGERITVRVPKRTPAQRKARNARITAMIDAGMTDAEIAGREGVSPKTVNRLRVPGKST